MDQVSLGLPTETGENQIDKTIMWTGTWPTYMLHNFHIVFNFQYIYLKTETSDNCKGFAWYKILILTEIILELV